MWKLLTILGYITVATGFVLFAYFEIADAKKSIPIGMVLAITGMCMPRLLKRSKDFEYNTALGSKLCAGSFMFMTLPWIIDLIINGPGSDLGDRLMWVGFPVFAIGMALNIYNMKKNGAI